MSKEGLFDFLKNNCSNDVEQKIEKLDRQKEQYEEELEKENKIFENLNVKLQNEQFSNDMIKDEINSLKLLLMKKGIIIEIENKNFHINEWENLFFIRKSEGYVIQSKHGEVIMNLGNEVGEIIEEISVNNSNSIIVTRVENRKITIQIRFKF